MKKKINNPLTNDGTAAVIASVPTFAIAEMIFHANPVAGSIIAGASGMVAWRHWEDVLRSLDSFLNWERPTQSQQAPNRTQTPNESPLQGEKPNGGIILGNDKLNKPVIRELKQLKNILILGLPGQGKSSLACWLLSQMITQYGARLIIIDRHACDNESLSAMLSPFENRFLRPPAYRFEDIQSSIEYAADIPNQRMEGDSDDRTPVIFVVDEFTNLMTSKKISGITDTVEAYNAMGRKYGCFSLCIGQLVNASRTGGTETRSLFATKLLLGMEKSQAQMIVDASVAAQTERLQPGECIVKGEGREDPFKIKFPKKSQKYYREQAQKVREVDNLNGSTSTQNHHFQAQNFEEESGTPVEVENDCKNASSSLSSASEVEILKSVVKRVQSGESVYSVCKKAGLPTSGRQFQEMNELLKGLLTSVKRSKESS